MSTASADRNLLFGILALQLDFIDRDSLIAAMHAWVLAKHRPLGDILIEKGALADKRRALLESLVDEHLRQHGGEVARSLAALPALSPVRVKLEEFADNDLHNSLASVSADHPARADPWATRAYRPDTAQDPAARFQVLRLHAKGGLGEVYVALDRELNRRVALKEIQGCYADDSNSRERFVLEAEITGGLEHPGVVPVYGLGHYPDGRPYYAMRFIKGDSFHDAIQSYHKANGGRQSLEGVEFRKLLSRFLAVCDAIAYAHSRGVLHRDLKPSNIMLGPYGETLVVDWGLAKAAGRPNRKTGDAESVLDLSGLGSVTPTLPGSVLGTPAYMSPEQAEGRLDRLGPASDVYGLGATLYCLLTGKAPFEEEAHEKALYKVQRGQFAAPRQVNIRVPPALEAICLKAMALRSEERYPTPRALAEDLEHWLADEPVKAFREPLRVQARRWARRHKPLVAGLSALVATALVLGGGGLGWWWWKRGALERAVAEDLGLAESALRCEGWAEAQRLLERAHDRLDDASSADLRQRWHRLQLDVHMVTALDEARMLRAFVRRARLNFAASERAYEQTFKDYDLPVLELDPDEAAQRVRASLVSARLVIALDDWAFVVSKQDENRPDKIARLVGLASRADANAWRQKLRGFLLQPHPKVLEALANSEEALSQPSGNFVLLLALIRDSKSTVVSSLLREAQRRFPDDFWINFELARLRRDSDPTQAVGLYRAALALRPQSPAVWNNLGLAYLGVGLRANDEQKEAQAKQAFSDGEQAFRKAIAHKSDYAAAYCNLGGVLLQQARLLDALDAFRMGRALSVDDPKLSAEADDRIRYTSLFAALEARLDNVLQGSDKPADAEESINFAQLCHLYKKRYASAVGFFERAFADKSEVAKKLEVDYRFDAACAAIQASCSQDKSDAALDETKRTELRRKALRWLRADLERYAELVEKDMAQARTEVFNVLQVWQHSDQLARVRGDALSDLAEDESKEWRKLWETVAALRIRASHAK
jgi:serine/threonine protein kinase